MTFYINGLKLYVLLTKTNQYKETPGVVFISPPPASVGLIEEEARAQNKNKK